MFKVNASFSLRQIFLVLMLIFCFCETVEANVRLQVLRCQEIEAYVDAITELALIVYREYPYLYDGTMKEYLPLIQIYATSQDGIACLLFDNKKLIGAAIGLPFLEMRDNYKELFADEDLKDYYYLGALLLLKQYRGQGFGKKMYTAFEESVSALKVFQTLCFCKIQEFDKHPLMPRGYQSLESFWKKLGYIEHPKLTFTIPWKDIDAPKVRQHTLVYWTKDLR